MKKIVLILCSLVFLMSALGAEEKLNAYEEFNSALGFQYGLISGSGISYYILLGRLGFQLTGSVLYFPDAESVWFGDRTFDANAGVKLEYNVYGNDFLSWISGRVYTFLGCNYNAFIPVFLDELPSTDPYEPYNVQYDYTDGPFSQTCTVGLGVGIELIVFRHLSVPVELGYAAVLNMDKQGSIVDKVEEINLYPQVGFRYRY